MTVSIHVPEQVEDVLRQAFGEDLDRTALESLAIEGFRSGRVSRYDVQRLLGFDNRWDTEEWLGARGAHAGYRMTDLDADRATFNEL